MSVKQFFKSTAFRCLATVLGIVLVCGIFLTLCDALFKVSDQEKFDRAITKIYGKTVETENVYKSDKKDVSKAEVLEAYKIKEDGNYLVKTKGLEGFDGGSVTCWVVVEMKDGKVNGVGKVVIDSNVGQSWIANIKEDYLNSFSTRYKEGESFVADLSKDPASIGGGASFSSNAITNAVNGSLLYVKSALLGESVVEHPYKDFDYYKYIEAETTYAVKNSVVTYNIVTAKNAPSGNFGITIAVDADKKVASYEITANGATEMEGYNTKVEAAKAQFDTLVGKTYAEICTTLGIASSAEFDEAKVKGSEWCVSGATKSSVSIVASFLFATANYDLAVERFNPYNLFTHTQLIDLEKTNYSVNGGDVTFNVVTKKNPPSTPFTITVVVGDDKKIKSFDITVNGATEMEGYFTKVEAAKAQFNTLVGKNYEEICTALSLTDGAELADANLKGNEWCISGATKSSMQIVSAALFATANYDNAVTYFNPMSLMKEKALIDLSKTEIEVNGSEVTFKIVTKKNAPSTPFTITVVVGDDKKIKSFDIIVNGATEMEGYFTKVEAAKAQFNTLVGKNYEEICTALSLTDGAKLADANATKSLTDNDRWQFKDNEWCISGATKSSMQIVSAALFATANYDVAVQYLGGNN